MSDKRSRRIQTAFRDAENSKIRLSAKRALDRALNEHDTDSFEDETPPARKFMPKPKIMTNG